MYLRQILFALLLLLGLAVGLQVSAEEQRSGFTIALTDGSQHTFYFDERPEITFDRGKINLKSTNFEVSYDRDDISNFELENVSSKVNDAVLDEVSFIVLGDIIKVSGVDKAQPVTVFNLNGTKVMELDPVSDSNVTIDLRGLSKGIYLVKIGNLLTVKFLKKIIL